MTPTEQGGSIGGGAGAPIIAGAAPPVQPRPIPTSPPVCDHPRGMLEDASYTCQSCGETIVVGVDPSAGSEQEYVEDCPVCCRPHVLRLAIARDGQVTLDARAE